MTKNCGEGTRTERTVVIGDNCNPCLPIRLAFLEGYAMGALPYFLPTIFSKKLDELLPVIAGSLSLI